MSLYQVDKLLFALFNDLELQEKYKKNADASQSQRGTRGDFTIASST